jgi:gas vesicle protein
MADDDRSTGDSTTFAFLTGALIGAAAGLLLAPRAGRELREQLSGYLRQSRDQWGQLGEQTKQTVSRAADRGREVMQKGREYAQEKGGPLGDAVRAGREAMQSERERLTGEQST